MIASMALLSLLNFQGDTFQAAEGLHLEPIPLERAAADDAERGELWAFSILPRVSGIFGLLDESSEANFQDLWKTGIGISFEGGPLFQTGRNWGVGVSLLVGYEVYQGDSFTDDIGQELVADNLSLSRFLVNAKIMYSPERGIFFDARGGLGFVSYSAVDGTFDDGTGEVDVSILKATTVFCFEVAAHVGFSGRRFWIAGGAALRLQGAPTDDDDIILTDTDDPIVLAFELEFGFKF